MPPKNRNKLGLTIPVDPIWKAIEGFNNTQSLPCTPNMYPSTATSPTPPRPRPPLEMEETEELQRLIHAPPYRNSVKKLSKQLSLSDRTRDMAWEKRRKQMIRQERRRRNSMETIPSEGDNLTDADLNELRGCIELGFGFTEEDGHRLCETLPALDLYFAVNRKLSSSPVSTPGSRNSSGSSNGGQSSQLASPKSEESWRICSPGDNPQQVKTKLRHWAQAVACSVMQQYS